MHKNAKDLNGKVFGRLTVIEEVGRSKHGDVMWKCVCSCGNEKIVPTCSLMKGSTKSCGCFMVDKNAEMRTTHGMSYSRIYSVHRAMVGRCKYKSGRGYNLYAGRGISVCDEWDGEHGFENFYRWALENGYDDSLSIDRIDNNKGYSPEDCRWADKFVQANNKRNNHLLEYNGEIHTMADWARITGINYNALRNRLKIGWNVEDALTIQIKKVKPCSAKLELEYNGKKRSISEWSKIYGVPSERIRRRIAGGWSTENAITVPVNRANSGGRHNWKLE